MSRTTAAELARLKCSYPLWEVARLSNGFVARTRDEFGRVALVRDTLGALEGDMIRRIGRHSKAPGAP